ncbi:hypothetical protein ACNQ6O_00685 [Marinobacter sp. SBS5]|uniref:hypothetical protein n=1 Tax=Marinobacter sp. SBS5 TaxID=3401754 RepID=UPI003AAC31E2
MSENSAKQLAAGCSPTCEDESLIIEVIGKEHPEGHTFRIYDETNYEQQEWLEKQVEIETLDNSVLNVWPWQNAGGRNVWLDIEAEEGADVRVPLFEGVSATKREVERQWNRILPLVPLTLIHDPEPEPEHTKEHVVPVRPGFIYVFRQGRLWRELEAQYTDQGSVEFRDVRLADYRQGSRKVLTEDRRPAVGKAQTAIWTPVCEMNRSLLHEFEMAFSEVQWSAQRVAYLETSDSARKERCQPLIGPEPVAEVASQTQDVERPGRLISLRGLPEMRLREPYLEQNLPKPWKSVYDLDGQYSRSLFSQAKEEAEAFAANEESAREAWEAVGYRDAALKGAASARLAALESQISGEESELWKPIGVSGDSLAKPREQGYSGIILQDHLFCVRLHVTQALSAQSLIEAVARLAQKSRHIASAHLVQSVILPEKLGGQKNPLNDFARHLDTTYFGPLHMTLRSAQRRIAREEMARAQNLVTNTIKSAEYQSALADLFTLKKTDYLEGFSVCSNIFQVLCQNPNDWNTESERDVVSEYQVQDANDLLLKIIEEGSDQPLHAMIFPSDEALAARSQPPEPEECGDGRCRPDDLKGISESLPEIEDSQSLAAVALAAVAKDDKSLELVTELKRWSAAVNTLLDGLQKHSQALLNKLKSRSYSLTAKFYGPLLRMAKARDPNLFDTVQLVARNAVPQGWLILGVSDPGIGLKYGLTEADHEYRHKANMHKRFYGEFYDSDGNILASTAKARLGSLVEDIDLGTSPQARDVQVFVAPEDSEVVKTHRQLRSTTKWERFFYHARIPYFVFAIEAFNLLKERHLLSQLANDKGKTRLAAGLVSGFADLTFASALVAERISKELGVWKVVPGVLDHALLKTEGSLIVRLFPTLAKALPEVITTRIVAGMATGGFALLVSVLDLAHEVDTADYDSAAAYGVSVIGTGMTMYGGVLMTQVAGQGAGWLALAGPWGWVALGLTLAIAGGVAAIFLDDEPLEEWLKRGPFGGEHDNEFKYLRNNPDESFYRLTNLLCRPRIVVKNASNFNSNVVKRGVVLTADQEREFSKVNTEVTIENNLCGLLDEVLLRSEIRLVEASYRGSNWGLGSREVTKVKSVKVVAEQSNASGKKLYLVVPERKSGITVSRIEVRAQWSAIWNGVDQCLKLVFPAPKLADDTRFDPEIHKDPDFTSVNQSFWANQKTHGIS